MLPDENFHSKANNTPPTTRWLIILLTISLLIRLSFLLWGSFPDGMVQDGQHYELLANSILQDGSFPSAARSPAYPAFLAMMHAIFGPSQTPIFIVQIILSLVSVFLMFLIAQDILGEVRWKTAIMAAACLGLNLDIAAYSVTILRETFTLFLVLLATFLCLRMLMRNWKYGFGLGVALTALIYIRQETAILFFVIMLGGLINTQWRKRTFTGGLIAITIVIMGTLPWVLHCHRHRGYTNIKTTFDSNLFCRTWYFSPSGQSEPELREHITKLITKHSLSPELIKRYVIPPILVAELPHGDVRAEASLYKKLGNIAKENLKAYPKQYVIDSLKMAKAVMGGYWLAWWPAYWDAPAFSENIQNGQWWVVIIKITNRILWPVCILSLSAIGLVLGWKKHDQLARPLTLILVGTFLSLMPAILLVQGDPRLRETYDGFLYLGMLSGLLMLSQNYHNIINPRKKNHPGRKI